MRPYYELRTEDINRAVIKAFGRTWPVSNFLGRVLPGDVGKRVYQVGDILQVENDEQRDTRLQEEESEEIMADEYTVYVLKPDRRFVCYRKTLDDAQAAADDRLNEMYRDDPDWKNDPNLMVEVWHEQRPIASRQPNGNWWVPQS